MPIVTRNLITKIGVTAAIFLSLACVTVGWQYWRFIDRLRLADQHSPIIKQALDADGRFTVVTVESFTGNNGTILVHALAPKGTIDELKAIVAKTSPPVPIIYDLKEIDTSTRPSE